jgi:hypothetical protein
MTTIRAARILPALLVGLLVSCGASAPAADGLRDSFAQQVAANRFITDFRRSGDDLTFSGPSKDGGAVKWRVHIDTASVEPNADPAQPYKGVVKSSWFADDEAVRPTGNLSNLPVELLSNGVSQDCWAFWVKSAAKWSWE